MWQETGPARLWQRGGVSSVVEVLEPTTAPAGDLAAWTALHTTGMTELMGSAPGPGELAARLRTGRAGEIWCWASRAAPGAPIQGVGELRRQPYDPAVGLMRLYVAEPARRQGMGAKLRQALTERASDVGLERLRSHTLVGPEMEAFVRSDGRTRTLVRFDMQKQHLDEETLEHCWHLAARPAHGYLVTYWEGTAPERLVASFGQVAVHSIDRVGGSRPVVEHAWTPDQVREWEHAAVQDGSRLVVCAALDRTSDQVVAATATTVSDTLVAKQFGTSVLPAHRRRGLATRVKANQALRVHDLFPHVRAVAVAVDQDNTAMLKLNRALRYEAAGERFLVEEDLTGR